MAVADRGAHRHRFRLRLALPRTVAGGEAIRKGHERGPAALAALSRAEVLALAAEAIAWIERHFGRDAEIVVSEQRYGYIRGAVAETVRVESRSGRRSTEAVDRILMHRFFGLPIFFLILWGYSRSHSRSVRIPRRGSKGFSTGSPVPRHLSSPRVSFAFS